MHALLTLHGYVQYLRHGCECGSIVEAGQMMAEEGAMSPDSAVLLSAAAGTSRNSAELHVHHPQGSNRRRSATAQPTRRLGPSIHPTHSCCCWHSLPPRSLSACTLPVWLPALGVLSWKKCRRVALGAMRYSVGPSLPTNSGFAAATALLHAQRPDAVLEAVFRPVTW